MSATLLKFQRQSIIMHFFVVQIIIYNDRCIHNRTGTQTPSFWPQSHTVTVIDEGCGKRSPRTGGDDSHRFQYIRTLNTQHRKQCCIMVLLLKASTWVLVIIISELLKATDQIQTSSSRSSNGLSRCCGMSSLKPFCSAKNWASMPRMNRHWTYSLHIHSKFHVSNYIECTTRTTYTNKLL